MRLQRIACGLLFCSLVSAGWPAASFGKGEGKTRVFLAFFGGPQFYSMSDINRGIQEDNEALEGSGFSIGELKGGAGFGAGIRVWTAGRLGFLFDYMHLTASTSNSGLINTTPVDARIDTPANSLTATVGYFRSWHSIRYGIGGGLGYYICDGSLESGFGSLRESSELEGSGLGFHALAMGDLGGSSALHFEAAVGYRSAKTSNLQSHDVDVTLDDGSKIRADYSGLMTRLGFSVAFDPGPYPGSGGAR